MFLGKKILFADDDVDFLEATQLMLLDKGFDVVTATDGVDAVEQYREIKPDIMFLDIKMPEIDGYEAFFRIVKSDTDARIVFTSSYALDDEKYHRAKLLSLRGLLNKPLEFRDLEKMIQKHSK
ncbi:MAG: response regulator [Nitrosopumilus sp.]|nr:MAG: response regulator [Nitrosopumilus sp.]